MTQRTKSHWKEYGTAFCATLVTATAGTCVGWASPTIPYLMSDKSGIPTTPDQGSWIVSIMILCSALTPIPSAYFADRYGRKTTLLLGAIPFILGWILIIMAKSVAVLYIARMMSGLGYGIVYTVSPMYTGEIATNEIRGALATLITLMNKLGILMQYCVGPFVSMKTLASINLSIPIMFVLTFAWLPESPYYHAQCGRMDKAEQSLRRLRDGDVRNELKEIEYNIQEDMRNKGTWGDLFVDRSNRKTLWIILGVFTIQQWCGSAAVVAYAQNFFSNTRSGLQPHEQSIILGCVQVITATTSFLLVDKLGRKPLLLVSSLGVALMNGLIGAYFVLSNEIGPAVTDYISWLPLIAILVYIIAYAIGLSTVPYVITAEMFPANVKSLASCFAHIYTGVSMFAVQKLYQVVADSIGIQYVFIGFSVFSSIGLVFILIALPETKGKSFASIQAQLKRPKSVLDKADALRAAEF